MRRLPWIAAWVLAAAAPAHARQAPDYPPALEREPLIAWLRAHTNIAPDEVVSVTPELVVALAGRSSPPSPGAPVRVTLREEVIDPDYVATVGGRSSLMSMQIECEARRVRMEERSLYPGLNLTGPAELTPASAAWVRIPEGSIMDEVAQAACLPTFDWPLRVLPASPVILAQAPPPPEPEPAPAPEPEPEPEAEPALPPPPPEAEPEPAPAPEPEAEPEPEPALPPPPPEPEPEPEAVESAPAPEPEIEAVAEPAPPPPAAEPAGPVFAVQIGAYRTEARALIAWEALATERPILVEGLRFETRPISVNGRDLLRGLVRDFATTDDAQAFCTALAGTGYGCILRRLTD